MPNATTSRSLEQYVELGRMGDALRCLRASSAPTSIEHDLLLAEVCVLAGHSACKEACGVDRQRWFGNARAVVKSQNSPGSSPYRCRQRSDSSRIAFRNCEGVGSSKALEDALLGRALAS